MDNEKRTEYKCDLCDKYFYFNSKLERHRRIHVGEKPFSCNVCRKSFNTNGQLNVHMREHTGENPYSCNTCFKSFAQKIHLISHKRQHSEQKSSDKNWVYFSENTSFDRHKRLLTGQALYTCCDCGKSFKSNSDLNIHKRAHTGEKPFKCDICRKVFAQKSYLDVHAMIHTSENPYSCDLCILSFSDLSSLSIHNKTIAHLKKNEKKIRNAEVSSYEFTFCEVAVTEVHKDGAKDPLLRSGIQESIKEEIIVEGESVDDPLSLTYGGEDMKAKDNDELENDSELQQDIKEEVIDQDPLSNQEKDNRNNMSVDDLDIVNHKIEN